MTDASVVHKDFVMTQLNGTDMMGDNTHTLLPASQEKHSPVSGNEKAKNAFLRYRPWLVGGIGLIVLAGLAWFLYTCCCRRRCGRVITMGFKPEPYQPLHAPLPAPAIDFHPMRHLSHEVYADHCMLLMRESFHISDTGLHHTVPRGKKEKEEKKLSR